MRHSIAYYIREQLREDRSVYIPGLGSFVLQHSPASISSDRQTIHPPTVSLLFDELVGDETPLLERISSVEDTTIKKAQKKLSKFTDTVFNKLININKADIEGIGRLVRESDEKIKFQDTVTSLTDEYHGLKSINIIPIKRMENNKQEEPKSTPKVTPTAENNYGIENMIVSEEQEESSSGKAFLIPIIGGLLLFAAYLLFTKGCDDTNIIGSDIDKEDKVEQAADKPNSLADSTDMTSILNEGETEIDGLITKSTDSDVDNKIESKSDATKGKTTAKGGTDIGNISKTDRAKSTGEVKYGKSLIQSVNYDGERCVIIVGSFKKAKNVLKMKDKVENMGYQSFTQNYKDFTRVGLQFNCKQSELDNYIAEARKRLESQAWYLEAPQN